MNHRAEELAKARPPAAKSAEEKPDKKKAWGPLAERIGFEPAPAEPGPARPHAELAAAFGGLCFTEEYSGPDAAYHWGCRCGCEWVSVLRTAAAGHWCPACRATWARRRPGLLALALEAANWTLASNLLAAGANPRERSASGVSALALAAKACRSREALEIVRFMVREGADPWIRDSDGRRPVDEAAYGPLAEFFKSVLARRLAAATRESKPGFVPASLAWAAPASRSPSISSSNPAASSASAASPTPLPSQNPARPGSPPPSAPRPASRDGMEALDRSGVRNGSEPRPEARTGAPSPACCGAASSSPAGAGAPRSPQSSLASASLASASASSAARAEVSAAHRPSPAGLSSTRDLDPLRPPPEAFDEPSDVEPTPTGVRAASAWAERLGAELAVLKGRNDRREASLVCSRCGCSWTVRGSGRSADILFEKGCPGCGRQPDPAQAQGSGLVPGSGQSPGSGSGHAQGSGSGHVQGSGRKEAAVHPAGRPGG